ncbi:MATA-HMG [Gigaspora margarita]|uniref:MATA-HMG n=1 Tax=Gigaspora margarita TaxID=4874 RepID=A0A8H4AKY1_GIGMA|nr:MATA-HMG [Gigaspora margarita]
MWELKNMEILISKVNDPIRADLETPENLGNMNAYVLFRRDFIARMKQQGMKMSIGDVSRLASGEWNKQPANVHRYFEILENLAKDKHKEIYPAFRYSPKKKLARLCSGTFNILEY